MQNTLENSWVIGETSAPLPPLAPGRPILGNAIEMGGDTVAFLAKMYQQLGPIFRVKALTREIVILGGVTANQFMNRVGDSVLTGGEFFGGLNEELNSTLVFPALDGEEHRYYRKLFRTSYSRDKITPRFDELVNMTRQRIRTWQPGQRIRVVPSMQEIITDQLGYSLSGTVSGEYFNDLRGTLATLITTKLMRSMPEILLKLPRYKRKRQRAQELMRQIRAAHEGIHARDGESGDLIDTALHATGYDGKPLNENDLDAIGFGAFFAGMDTASHTSSFTLYLLLKHPEIIARVVEEVDDLFKRDSFTFLDLRHLDTLHRSIIESMRLYPVAPIMPRHASQTFEFEGYRVEKGASVMVVTGLTHYLPDIFPDPLTFNIDRPSPKPFTFAPFGQGAHTCMGAGLADVLITLTLATLFHQLEFELDPADFQMKVIGVPVPNPGQNFYVKVKGYRN